MKSLRLKVGILFSIILCFLSSSLKAASLTLDESKDDDQSFTEKVTQEVVVDDLPWNGNPQIGRTSKLIKGKETLIAFTAEDPDDHGMAKSKKKSDEKDSNIYLNVFLKESRTEYLRLSPVVACGPAGDRAEVKAFFYLDMHGEPAQILGVICTWPGWVSKAADCALSDEVVLFKVTAKIITEIPMKKYEHILYTNVRPEPDATYSCRNSNFKTVQDVKKLLAR